MSVNCPIVVSFEVSKRVLLKEIGNKHLPIMRARADENNDDKYDADAHRLLQYVADGNGVGRGPKGDMFTWGNVGNYGSLDRFVGALQDFWQDLFRARVIQMGDGVVVMFQQEQTPFMQIAEISSAWKSDKPGSVVFRTANVSFPLYGWYFERSDALLPPCQTESWEDI